MNALTTNIFDTAAKEAELRAESQTWDTNNIADAEPGDIPVIDVANYFATNSTDELESAAGQLRDACLNTGFYTLTWHDFSPDLRANTFAQIREFHTADASIKNAIMMDREGWPVKGAGYLPVKNKKLPARDRGNLNEAFIVKRDHSVSLNDNQWPNADVLPDFRNTVERYATEIEALAKKLLPIYARALDVEADFFR